MQQERGEVMGWLYWCPEFSVTVASASPLFCVNLSAGVLENSLKGD